MNNIFLPKAYFKGAIVDFDKAQVSIATQALHYGTAAFAGMRVEVDKNNKGQVRLFRPDVHAKRLSSSAKILGYDLSPDQILKAIKEFIAANNGTKPYYLRPLVYVSDLGVSPRLYDVEYDFLIYGLDMGDYLNADGIKCCFSSWVQGEDRSLPLRGKISGSYVSSALAKTEAHNRGFDEALLLNSAGKVAEASAMNVFMLRDGALITPDVSQEILEGVTRRSVIQVAKDLGIEVIERAVDRSELLIADEVFLTGTAARITPVKQIEQYKLPENGPVTNKLASLYKKIVAGKEPKYTDWSVVLPAKKA